MMKKVILTTAAFAAVLSMAAFADGGKKVEAGGVSFEIPAELQDLVTVRTEGLGANELVAVYETASIEAAKANGENEEGAGWIFTIARLPENEVRRLRCGAMDGMEIFAEDEDQYLLYLTPTDVRMVRENYDDADADLEQFGDINEWAGQNVCAQILANDPELDPETFTNTLPDMLIARAAYDPTTNFTVRSLAFGENDPVSLGGNDFIEDLAEDVTFEEAFDLQAPDGEYLVLAFPDDDVRLDFFMGDENLVREVRTFEDGEQEFIYRAAVDDNDDTAYGIMQEWVNAILNGEEDDD